MRINKRLLSKHDVEMLYQHWAGVTMPTFESEEQEAMPVLSELTGLTEGTLEKFYDGETVSIPAEKLVSLFLATNTSFERLLPPGFIPSGSREVEEVLQAAINEYGPLPIKSAIKLIQDYFSVDESWANEKVLSVFENSLFHVENGKIALTELNQADLEVFNED